MKLSSRQTYFALVALLCCGLAVKLSGASPRIIILFTADNLGPGDLDQERIELPNLNFLKDQSTRFNNFHSTSSLKTSAFFSIYSGLDSGQHIFRDSIHDKLTIPSSTQPLAKELNKLNFETAFSGSWPFGNIEELSPEKFGFNFFYGYYNRLDQHPRFPSSLQFNQDKIELNNIFIPRNFKFQTDTQLDENSIYRQFEGQDYASEIIHRATINFIEKKLAGNDKVFLHYAHNGLRPGMQANPEDLNKTIGRVPDIPYAGQNGFTPCFSPRAAQIALLTELDRHLGELISLLKSKEVFDKSLIIFTSPNAVSRNGGRDLNFFSSNQNLKGERGTLYQGGLRTPCLSYWPEISKKNDVNSDLISQTTIYQSILSVAAGENKPIFLPSTELYWESASYRALRKDKYKLIQKKSLLTPSSIQLFDLESDPTEDNNIADEKTAETESLIKLANSRHLNLPSAPSPFDIKPENQPDN